MSVVYGTYTQAELEAQYDTAVPIGGDSTPYLARFVAESERARAALPIETIRYGRGDREILDYIPGSAAGAPLFVWVHGGYWRRLSKDANTFVAPPFVAAGAAVTLINYPLAPAATLDEIVASVRAAHACAVARATIGGVPPRRIVAGGHSVGAQLAAAIAAVAPLDGLVGLSGLYDLQPLRFTSINDTIGMDEATAARHAPIALAPVRASQLLLSTGEREQAEFHRQQSRYADAWRAWGGDVRELAAPGDDHFSIVLELGNPQSALARAVTDLVTAID